MADTWESPHFRTAIMALTLGFTGMDQSTETSLRSVFSDANARVGHWVLVNESDAQFVVVDMDSMYGPMSWLRLHASGKHVIGFTSAPRTQADYRLGRPADMAQMAELLRSIAIEQGIEVGAAPVAAAPASAAASAPAPAPAPAPPSPAAASMPPPAPPVAAQPAPPPVMPPAMPPAAPVPPPAQAPVAQAPVAPPVAAPTPPPAPAPADAPPPSSGAGLVDWLRPGALSGRARLQRGKAPALLIDFIGRQYFGPATLKPLSPYFESQIAMREFEQLDDAGWQTAIGALGEPQSMTRLLWLGGLLAGGGKLLPGLDPGGRFILNKWPQTEREYPRHFRIATVMMKGPQTIAEIAAGSGSSAEDVADFINANLSTGFAEPAPGGGGGLLGRLRGTR